MSAKTLVTRCIVLTVVCAALRLGSSVQLLHSALMYSKLHDTALRSSLILNNLALACYLLVDHAVWAAKLGLIAADASKLGRIAARLWLISLIAALLRDVIEILRALRTEMTKHREANHAGDFHYSLMPQSVSVVSRIAANRPLLVDCVKNAADIFLPAAVLGYVNVGDCFQGLLGIVSSYMAVLTIWDPALKLSP